ncbi:MAG: hypothetical protein R3E92_20460 [Burkholderiaceae bacterium]|nr:hypothetical protein [Rhodoferax sp.]MCP5263021.1 hypothetical protein [Rhodoferax sp.]
MAIARWHNEAQAQRHDRDQGHDGVAARPDRSLSGAAHAATARPVVGCPSCGAPTIRIWRRPSDRLLSVFVPVSRHRCESHDCRWEGNVRSVRSKRSGAAGRNRADEGRVASAVPAWFIVHMVLVVVGIVFVFSAAHLDWIRAPAQDTDSFIAGADRTVFNRPPVQKPDAAAPGTDAAITP